MRISIMLLLCVALSGAALAAEKPTVQPVPVKESDVVSMAAPAGVCVYGNQNPAAWAIPDWMWGAEEYTYLFDAEQPACGCSEGFTVEAVNMLINFGPEDVPVNFQAAAVFRETEFSAEEGCLVPGAEICRSTTYGIDIIDSGLYNIALPIAPQYSLCAYFGHRYAVGVDILTAFPSSPDPVTDEFPVGCTSFVDYGSGWIDLIDFNFPGEIMITADIVCCAPAVPGEQKAWGDVKSLYR